MTNLVSDLDLIVNNYKGGQLIEKLFIFVKDRVDYRFGDWRVDPEDVLYKGHGMCTTKSRLLYHLLHRAGFRVYFKILRINSRGVFGKFTLPEIAKYLSENSVHFYVVVDLDGKFIELDCSLDSGLEDRLTAFGYIYDRSWSLPSSYVNFIDDRYIISKSDLVDSLNYYINKRIGLKSRFKFFVSNICLDYIRTCNLKELQIGHIEKNNFLNWLKRKNIIYYIFFLIIIQIKK